MSIPFLSNRGTTGERLAKEYLEELGLKTIGTNVRVPHGEIDIVMRDEKTNEIVFVEVRTRTFSEFGTPEESIGPKKAHILNRSIQFYMQKYPWNTKYRADAICVVLNRKDGKVEEIRHLKGVIL